SMAMRYFAAAIKLNDGLAAQASLQSQYEIITKSRKHQNAANKALRGCGSLADVMLVTFNYPFLTDDVIISAKEATLAEFSTKPFYELWSKQLSWLRLCKDDAPLPDPNDLELLVGCDLGQDPFIDSSHLNQALDNYELEILKSPTESRLIVNKAIA